MIFSQIEKNIEFRVAFDFGLNAVFFVNIKNQLQADKISEYYVGQLK
jgi:hypothetical protein